MSYEVKTTQPGKKVDIFTFATYGELLDDLEAVESLPSIKVNYIKKDGQFIDIENCFLDISVDEFRNW